MGNKEKRASSEKRVGNRWLKKDCFPTVMNALITAVIAAGVSLLVDLINPRYRASERKDELLVALAERLTGKVDDATVERVRRDVVRYLGDSLRNYPTREEFNRDKNRHIDKKNGVVWEERMEDGNLMLVPVSAYTNENTKIGR